MWLYVHGNRRLTRDGSPGRPPRLSHSSWTLKAKSAAKKTTTYSCHTLISFDTTSSLCLESTDGKRFEQKYSRQNRFGSRASTQNYTLSQIDCCCCCPFFYSAIFPSRADSLRSHVILHEWLAFYSVFLNIHRSGVLTAVTWLVSSETAAVSARSVYTTQPCAVSLHAKPRT